jgi:hypothetical protein
MIRSTHVSLTLVRAWLILAISSVAIAGLFSLPPVIFRGPFFAEHFDTQRLFDMALVIHVDLSVLVWLLSMGGVMWSIATLHFRGKEGIFQWTAFILAATGALSMTLAPFLSDGVPLKSNYIPVLDSAYFLSGLFCFGAGIALQIFITLFSFSRHAVAFSGRPIYFPLLILPITFFRILRLWAGAEDRGECSRVSQLRVAIYGSAVMTLIALICFGLTAYNYPTDTFSPKDGTPYYELLFWGGGHILQYTYTTLMLISWLWLAGILGYRIPFGGKTIIPLFFLGTLLVVPVPLVYLWYETGVSQHYDFFTDHMRYGGGLVPMVIGAGLLMSFTRMKRYESKIPHDQARPIVLLLWFSPMLFIAGGALGFVIHGSDVTVPAHYHGSIVGVTASLMALCYYLLPELGFGRVRGKLATLQPLLYGIGQLSHVLGLAWMGGYGALRKTADSTEAVHTVAGKLMFFIGGAGAILGGLLFIIVVFAAIFRAKEKNG